MPGIFLAPSSVEAPPSVNLESLWPGIVAMTFHPEGGDTAWDLLGDSGVLLMSKGLRGLDMPPVKRQADSSPAVHGTRYRGHRVDERPVFWPLLVYSDEGSQAWIEHDRALWEDLEPGKLGTWTITHPDGKTRSLRVRFDDDSDHASDRDPSKSGWEVYGLHLVAEQPFWEGDAVTREWESTVTVDFFNGGAAPPFLISSGAAIGTATMSNPGRVPAWPVWTVFGPTSSVDLGLDGKVVEAHFPVPSGKALVVDTDPTAQTAILYSHASKVIDPATAEDVTGELGAADFRPIPPGSSVVLSLALTGSGSVRADLRPRYYRAW